MRYLHLADNVHKIPADQPGHDTLYKVQNILSRQFQSTYTPTEYVTIDEAMIPFKGRLAQQFVYKMTENHLHRVVPIAMGYLVG